MKHICLFLCLLFMMSPAVAYEESDLKQLKTTNKRVECDLTNSKLVGMHLSKANLSERT